MIKIPIISLFVGLISGALSTLFLYSLSWVTSFRTENSYLIWGLPIFGLFFGLLIKIIPHHVNQGVPYILEELENDKAKVSPWMTPFIFLSSLGTHLFGGSAGREGVGVIMGASAAHLLPKLRTSFQSMRPFLIYAGLAAGFSSIFATPLAAIVFAFELQGFKHIRKYNLVMCAGVASFIAVLVPKLLEVTHQHYHVDFLFSWELLPYLILASLSSAFGGHLFYWGMKGYTRLISHLFPHIVLKLTIGGLLVSFLVYFTGSYAYIGIGTDTIAESFISEMSFYDFAMKCLLTIMTISIGFKGGEVTPLFFMGSTFSNSMASFFNFNNFALSSSLGMTSLFGAVTGTPLASAVMAGELFGWKVGCLCLISCYLSRFLMGNHSIYRH